MCLEVFLIDNEPVFLMLMILPSYTFGKFAIYNHGVAKTLRMDEFKKEGGYRWNTICVDPLVVRLIGTFCN